MMNKGNNADQFNLMTQKETALFVRMSESWLERQRWERKGIPYIKIGGKVFYDKQDVVTWLTRQKRTGQAKKIN